LNSISFECTHVNSDPTKTFRLAGEDCTSDCYLKLFKNSRCLIEAVLRMYETSSNLNFFDKYLKNQVTPKEQQANPSVDMLNFDKQRKVSFI
jgi:hypothetical protein